MRLATALLVTLIVSFAGFARGDEAWRPLFNGRDLDAWTVKIRGYPVGENYGDTFRVEDGLLKVRFDQYDGRYRGRYGHLFFNEPLEGDYRLRIEYRVPSNDQAEGGPTWANRNSGVMLFGQRPETMGLDQKFPVSLEVQLLGGQGGGSRPTANLCTPGTNVVMAGELHTQHCTSSQSPTFDDGEWVTVEVEVRSGTVRHIVAGQTVLEYHNPQLDPTDADAQALLAAGADKLLAGGALSLQAESHPFDFRRVELLTIEPSTP